MCLTIPIWLLLSCIWIICKFCFFFILSLILLATQGFASLNDLLLYPIRLIYQTFKNYDVIFDWFSDFYYEHFWWSMFLGFVLMLFYISQDKNYN
jgi:hypothetical protein